MNPDRVRKYLPSGPCLICGVPTSYTDAHRLIDAIRDRRARGETVAELAKDYHIPREIVSYLVRTPIEQLDYLRRIKR